MDIRTRVFAALLSVAWLATPAFAQSIPVSAAPSQGPALSHIRIGNFGKINNNYFRGAQPKGGDYADLAALGVKTVIDLQKDGPSKEAGYVKAAGMNFFRIGMTTTDASDRCAGRAVLQDRERPGEPARIRALRGRTPPHGHDDGALPDDV